MSKKYVGEPSDAMFIAGILFFCAMAATGIVLQIINTHEQEKRFQTDIEQYDCKVVSHDLGNERQSERICYTCNDGVERCK